ncbi:MAG: SdpI family protein, partial [Myxococcota bacterium]
GAAIMTANLFTRWFLPIALISAGLLLSAFVFFAKLPEPARVVTPQLMAALGATPGLAAIVFVSLRIAMRNVPASDASADLLVVWIVTFLFGLHAAILGAMIGMVPSLKAVVPTAVGVLLLGLGPVLGTLEPQNPLGIRTQGTLADPELWARTHRLAGWLIALAGILGLLGAQYAGRWALICGVGPAVFGLIVALGYGSQSPRKESDEETEVARRLAEESSVDATDS